MIYKEIAMEGFKNFFKDKGVGYYVTVLATVLALATMIVYVSYYGHGPREANIDCMNWVAFYLILAGIVLTVALLIFNQRFWATVSISLFSFVSLLFYIYGVYGYVSVVAVGIDLKTLSPGFLACTILYVLTIVFAYASVFLKQKKEIK